MTRKEEMTRNVKKAACHIIKKYQMGDISREYAHELLAELNNTCFAMYTFNLSPIDPGETQEYIHALQEKYTTVYV